MTHHPEHLRARAEIDLAALRANVQAVKARVAPTGAALMAVVKADAYGHGMVECARAARAAGAQWLGTAVPQEALALRAAGVEGPLMCWLWSPGGPWRECVEADIDVSVSDVWALAEVGDAARAAGRRARVHLKADTGLGRSGCQPADWTALVEEAIARQSAGELTVTGLWSHLACADEPGHPSVGRQLDLFRRMVAQAEAAGVEPEVRHIANSAAALTLPASHFDLVRVGIALYGMSPSPELGRPEDFGLRPVMTLSASLAQVKSAPEGHGVGYGHTYRTERDTTLGLVPVGYADGVPRQASGAGPLLIEGETAWRRIAGRVAMDQFTVDLGGDTVAPGSRVLLFGPGDQGEPTAQDWADASGTIAYEIVTRIGPRVPRVFRDDSATRVGAGAAVPASVGEHPLDATDLELAV